MVSAVHTHAHTRARTVGAAGPLAKRLCPIPGTAAMSGLLVMRNEVSVLLAQVLGSTLNLIPLPVSSVAEPL